MLGTASRGAFAALDDSLLSPLRELMAPIYESARATYQATIAPLLGPLMAWVLAVVAPAAEHLIAAVAFALSNDRDTAYFRGSILLFASLLPVAFVYCAYSSGRRKQGGEAAAAAGGGGAWRAWCCDGDLEAGRSYTRLGAKPEP